jgi:uncharacterized membrane protein
MKYKLKIKKILFKIIMYGILILSYAFSFSLLSGDGFEKLPVIFLILLSIFFCFPGFAVVMVFFDPDSLGSISHSEAKEKEKREEEKILQRPYIVYVGAILMMITIASGFYYYGQMHERIGYERSISKKLK